ncbi:MAG: hypothetical protein EPO40_31175 [Myxococcaceae bacterium]|nr:MAG: hypothetical protein EPO40_31175 [Myxococcaceae bacterium]
MRRAAQTSRSIVPPTGDPSRSPDSDESLGGLSLGLGAAAMAALAPYLGKDNARSVRDWCQRHRIPYRRDGKHNWVALADVRAVIAGLPLCTSASERRAPAAMAAVASLMGRK